MPIKVPDLPAEWVSEPEPVNPPPEPATHSSPPHSAAMASPGEYEVPETEQKPLLTYDTHAVPYQKPKFEDIIPLSIPTGPAPGITFELEYDVAKRRYIFKAEIHDYFVVHIDKEYFEMMGFDKSDKNEFNEFVASYITDHIASDFHSKILHYLNA